MLVKPLSEEHLKEVLTELFKRVGQVYKPVLVRQKEWYLAHSWTADQQYEFETWLTEFLITHKYASKRQYRTQSIARHAAQLFVLDYGWKIDD